MYLSAFTNAHFRQLKFIYYHGLLPIDIGPINPSSQNKNVLESKHRIMRDVFLRIDYVIWILNETHLNQ